jgi:hypothetical protein
MARHVYTEVSQRSWFGRVGSSFAGMLIGLVLVVATVVGLFWNEGRAVTTARSLAEGRGLVVSVPADRVDPAHEGGLIHVSAPLAVSGPLVDRAFGVSEQALRLVRRVEMYQWKETSRSETKTKLGGGEETVTTYTYEEVWADGRIDSGSFHRAGYDNPPLAVEPRTLEADTATLGAFTVDRGILSQVGEDRSVAVDATRSREISAALGLGRPLKVVGGKVLVGADPERPEIGDLRISFTAVPPLTISAVGKQTGTALGPYQTVSGDALLMAENGTVAADVMFSNAETANTVLTWVLRLAGLLLMWVGFALLMAPFGVLADVIPLLGSIVRFGTGLFGLFLTALVGLPTIALAWFWYRPLVTLAILAAGALVLAAVWYLGRARGTAAPAGTAPA